jgi:hypothetical protein
MNRLKLLAAKLLVLDTTIKAVVLASALCVLANNPFSAFAGGETGMSEEIPDIKLTGNNSYEGLSDIIHACFIMFRENLSKSDGSECHPLYMALSTVHQVLGQNMHKEDMKKYCNTCTGRTRDEIGYMTNMMNNILKYQCGSCSSFSCASRDYFLGKTNVVTSNPRSVEEFKSGNFDIEDVGRCPF